MTPRSEPTAAAFELGEWRFEPELHRLSAEDRRVRLQPKVSALLLCLVRRSGRVVSKDELVAEVWEGRFLADSALSRTMAELRQALGDDARNPTYIETIPKLGYRLRPSCLSNTGSLSGPAEPRLVADEIDASPSERPQPETRSKGGGRPSRVHFLFATLLASIAVVVTVLALRPADRAEPGRRSPLVAVLPLADLSAAPEAYFAQGMTETLVARLAETSSVGVVSRHSVGRLVAEPERLLERAREVGIDALVEGSIQRDGDAVRVTVQLTEIGQTRYSWVESYEREIVDILALQSDISRAIAREVRATLQPEASPSWSRPQTVEPRAWDLCLKANSLQEGYEKSPPRKAYELFLEATTVDPDYAAGWVGLAQVLLKSSQIGMPVEDEPLAKAEAAIDRALRTDPYNAQAHALRGTLQLVSNWNLEAAEAAFQKALDINPSDADVRRQYASYLTFRGRFDQAIRQARRAATLDPFNEPAADAVSHALLHGGRYDELYQHLDQMEERFGSKISSQTYGYWALALEGRSAEALVGLRGNEGKPWDAKKPGIRVAPLAWTLATSGRREEALELRAQLAANENADPFFLAIIDAGLGDADQAIVELERAFEVRSPNLPYIGVEPFLGPIRDDPRLQEMTARLGI